MQMKRRQWARNSLPACKNPVPHTWLPYMPSGIAYVLSDQIMVTAKYETETQTSIDTPLI